MASEAVKQFKKDLSELREKHKTSANKRFPVKKVDDLLNDYVVRYPHDAADLIAAATKFLGKVR